MVNNNNKLGEETGLPSRGKVFKTFPDALFIPELVLGGFVWTLLASTKLPGTALIHGWVMGVSIFCFLFTFILLCLYIGGAHKNKPVWLQVDTHYHFVAACLYTSAGILQAISVKLIIWDYYFQDATNISATVFALVTCVIYICHGMGSQKRWSIAGKGEQDGKEDKEKKTGSNDSTEIKNT
ncbi:myelin and lymphocyte protein-like [Discoglossus pictus]